MWLPRCEQSSFLATSRCDLARTLPFRSSSLRWSGSGPQVALPVERGAVGALSPRSRDIHEGNLRRDLVPFFGEREVRGIRPADVQALHDSLAVRARPLGPQSIEHVMATPRLLLTYAEVRELVTSNAVVNWKRTRRFGRAEAPRHIA